MIRQCPQCGRTFSPPIQFCEEDGSRLAEPSAITFRLVAEVAAVVFVVAAIAWFNLRAYLSSTLVLEVSKLSHPKLMAEGKSFTADAGPVSIDLSLKNGSPFSVSLTRADFDIDMAGKPQPPFLITEALEPAIPGNSAIPIRIATSNGGALRLDGPNYDLTVRARYRASVWGIPVAFPGLAKARVTVGVRQ